jgi:hypothetical protein
MDEFQKRRDDFEKRFSRQEAKITPLDFPLCGPFRRGPRPDHHGRSKLMTLVL